MIKSEDTQGTIISWKLLSQMLIFNFTFLSLDIIKKKIIYPILSKSAAESDFHPDRTQPKTQLQMKIPHNCNGMSDTTVMLHSSFSKERA